MLSNVKGTQVYWLTFWLLLENLVAHRTLQLLDMLPKAVSLGMSDTDEPLKVCSHYSVYRMCTD